VSNGERKEISLMVCKLTAGTVGLPPHPEVTESRLRRETGQASCRIRTLLFRRADLGLFRELLGSIALEAATREKDAQKLTNF